MVAKGVIGGSGCPPSSGGQFVLRGEKLLQVYFFLILKIVMDVFLYLPPSIIPCYKLPLMTLLSEYIWSSVQKLFNKSKLRSKAKKCANVALDTFFCCFYVLVSQFVMTSTM